MSTRIWRGDAPAIAQVTTFTVTGDDATTTYKITINGKVVSVLGTGSGVNATALALQAALVLAANSIPEFAEVTWTVSTAVVTGTAVTAGVPFTATSSVSGGSGAIGAASTTAGSGPNDLGLAANWSGGVLPATSDTIVFDSNTVDALYNLDALAAVATATLKINASYTGKIGLPSYNGNYYEYRQQYLQLNGATLVSIGYGAGTGSGRIKLDFLTSLTTVNVVNAAPAADTALGLNQAVLLKGTNASNVVSVNRGTVGIAALPGETATVLTLNVGYTSQILGDATVYCGSGVTLTTVNQAGGTLTTQSAITTLIQTAGVLYQLAGTITTATIEGTHHAQASGTFATTIHVLDGGVLDLSQDMRSRTAGTCNLYAGATLNDPFGTSFAGGPMAFKCVECTLADVTVNVGLNHTYTPS